MARCSGAKCRDGRSTPLIRKRQHLGIYRCFRAQECRRPGKFLAYHDVLTRLPNQLLFQDRFQQAIAFSSRGDRKLALVLVDLDRFKSVNDVFGHEIGNLLLVEVAKRLERGVRSTDTVCRQGGDEFPFVAGRVFPGNGGCRHFRW